MSFVYDTFKRQKNQLPISYLSNFFGQNFTMCFIYMNLLLMKNIKDRH